MSDAGELLRALYGRGETQRQVALRTGISERMQRHVVKGTKPGTSYVGTLTEYRDRGTVVAPAPVRRQRVRAPGGETVLRTRSTAAPRPAPGRYGHSAAVTAGGAGRVETWTFPATPGAQRGRAAVELVQTLRRHGSGTVRLQVTLRDPETRATRTAELYAHGIRAATLLQSARNAAKRMGLDRRQNVNAGAGLLRVIAEALAESQRYGAGAGFEIVGVTIEG